MDRARLEYHLAQAECHENHIARHRQIISRLAKDIGQLANGARDLKVAQAVLAQLQATQASHVAERDRLRAELTTMK
jgi:hemerythrin